MIIYLAGAPGCIQRMPHAEQRYEHVLFSFFVYQKKDFRWMRERKLKALKKARKEKVKA